MTGERSWAESMAGKKEIVPQVQDPRAALLDEIRKLLTEFGEIERKAHSVMGRVYAATHGWVRYAVDTGQAKSVRAACGTLARELDKTQSLLDNWFYAGKFMAHYGLNPEVVNGSSVRYVFERKNNLTEPELKRCVALIKAKAPHAEVQAVAQKSNAAIVTKAKNKGARLSKKGDLTKARCVAELRAALVLLRKHYKRDVGILVYDENGKELLDVE